MAAETSEITPWPNRLVRGKGIRNKVSAIVSETGRIFRARRARKEFLWWKTSVQGPCVRQ